MRARRAERMGDMKYLLIEFAGHGHRAAIELNAKGFKSNESDRA
jgi:hypothetical protein